MPRRRARAANAGAAILCAALFAFTGCNASPSSQTEQATTHAAPTVGPLFNAELPTPLPLPTPAGAMQPRPEGEQGRQAGRPQDTFDMPVFDDDLDLNWSLDQTGGMRYRLTDRYVHSGRSAIEARPTGGNGVLFFTVPANASAAFPRDRTLGVSFWLNSGDGIIATDDLAVTVLGSNAYDHWVANDTSVQMDGRDTSGQSFLFSETRLYYLGINRDIPPDTWVEVILWIEDRQFDPFYDYVTGFYIKNDAKFQNTFYIDNVNLILLERS